MKQKISFLILGLLLSTGMVCAQQRLDDFLQAAMKNSPLLHEGQNNLKLLGIDSSLIQSQYKTQVGFQSDGVYAPVVNGFGYDNVVTNGQTLDALVSFDKLIPNKSRVAALMAGNQINRQQQQNQLKITANELKKEVTDQYLATYGDLLQWQYNRTLQQSLQQEREMLKKLTAASIYHQADYMTFVVSLKKQQLSVNDAMLQYKTDLAQLKTICGILDTSITILAAPDLQVNVKPVMDSSIYFMKFHYDSLSLANQETLIDQSYKPVIKLHADAGYLSSLTITPYKNFGLGAGVSVAVPIYDGHQRNLHHQQIQLQEDNLSSEKTFFAKQYQQRMQQYYREITDLEKQDGAIEAQIKLTETLIDADRRLLAVGQIDMTQYFMVIQDYIDSKNRQSINKVKRLLLVNEINYWK